MLHNVTPFKELDSAKTNFLATVSHELKTPISSIKMSLQLLKNETSDNLNAGQIQLIDSIAEDVGRLLKITSELLNMTQIETGNIQLSIGPVEPQKIVHLATEAVSALAEQKQIRLQVYEDENLPPVSADLDKSAWVMVNLLTNAIRHAPENSQINISVTLKGRRIEFLVKDYGGGIDGKYVSRVFERYFKVPGSEGGTGLGLAICKEFIEAQGGRIWVESKPGAGATFGFELNS
ncbi:MAG TPA: HAMP domain-containing sensor histidine kinase [Chitinophagales bacterium]|nr:HAMP domain-containing sensor histidine kinase [Chitinophagales bacterium]